MRKNPVTYFSLATNLCHSSDGPGCVNVISQDHRGNLKLSALAPQVSLQRQLLIAAVRLRQGYGATVFALLLEASEDWPNSARKPAPVKITSTHEKTSQVRREST
jgi:hypothetical protein